MRFFVPYYAAAIALTAAFMLLAPLANAHSWYSQKIDPVYKSGCCGISDCARLMTEEGVMSVEDTGYRIVLTHEQAKKINPYATSGINALVTWDRVQPSEDGNWHICIMTHHRDNERGGIYCLFAPPNS